MYLLAAIQEVADEYERMSVRQLFYHLVARGYIEITNQAYKRVCDISAQMRLTGELDYRKIVDGHRTRRCVYQHGGLRQALENAFELHRRNYWLDQPEHVDVWCERDALTDVIQPACEGYGMTYVATRGFPSITLIHHRAQTLKAPGKPMTIIYFGDHDASGRSISGNLERDLRAHGADVTVTRQALNPDQIAHCGLPTHSGKWTESMHAKFAAQFGDECVELDSLPPSILTGMIAGRIESKIERDSWYRAMRTEALERAMFESIAAAGWDTRLYLLGTRRGIRRMRAATMEDIGMDRRRIDTRIRRLGRRADALRRSGQHARYRQTLTEIATLAEARRGLNHGGYAP
jgi:hypothetical protein